MRSDRIHASTIPASVSQGIAGFAVVFWHCNIARMVILRGPHLRHESRFEF